MLRYSSFRKGGWFRVPGHYSHLAAAISRDFIVAWDMDSPTLNPPLVKRDAQRCAVAGVDECLHF